MISIISLSISILVGLMIQYYIISSPGLVCCRLLHLLSSCSKILQKNTSDTFLRNIFLHFNFILSDSMLTCSPPLPLPPSLSLSLSLLPPHVWFGLFSCNPPPGYASTLTLFCCSTKQNKFFCVKHSSSSSSSPFLVCRRRFAKWNVTFRLIPWSTLNFEYLLNITVTAIMGRDGSGLSWQAHVQKAKGLMSATVLK